MASADWAEISDAASSGSVKRGVVTSAVVTMVSGGSSYCYGMNSLVAASGVVASYSALGSFSPMAKLGDVNGALQKGTGAAGDEYSAYLFCGLNGQASTNSGYILGLSDSNPAHIILRKGPLSGGCPDVAPGTQGVLRRSTATYAKGTWVHLRLECIIEPSGDVVINCYQSDLGAHAVTSPSWVAIAGMAAFTDDFLQINTGSAPIPSGRIGWGATFSDIHQQPFFDQIVTSRQLTP